MVHHLVRVQVVHYYQVVPLAHINVTLVILLMWQLVLAHWVHLHHKHVYYVLHVLVLVVFIVLVVVVLLVVQVLYLHLVQLQIDNVLDVKMAIHPMVIHSLVSDVQLVLLEVMVYVVYVQWVHIVMCLVQIPMVKMVVKIVPMGMQVQVMVPLVHCVNQVHLVIMVFALLVQQVYTIPI
jgi:hypothetical protein